MPPLLQGEATARAIRLAEFVNTPLYVVHVMSRDAMEEVARARCEGQLVAVVLGGVCVGGGVWLGRSRVRQLWQWRQRAGPATCRFTSKCALCACRQRGARVIGETVASAIAVDESRLWDPDFGIAAQYVMSPPIRGKEHGDAIKRALAGGLLQVCGGGRRGKGVQAVEQSACCSLGTP